MTAYIIELLTGLAATLALFVGITEMVRRGV